MTEIPVKIPAEPKAPPKHAPVPSARRDTLLYLDGVSRSFDGFKAINELSFVLMKGEMRAIIGPNGAGKTTMMDIITGKTRPDKGDVFFMGDVDLTKHDEPTIAQMGIGRKFQKPTVFETQTVADNLLLSLKGERRGIPAEKLIDRDYLEQLNEVYSEFFLYYDAAPLLIVNANEIDLAQGDQDYELLVDYMLNIKKGRHYFNPNFFS